MSEKKTKSALGHFVDSIPGFLKPWVSDQKNVVVPQSLSVEDPVLTGGEVVFLRWSAEGEGI